jgi:hypothetical protein
MTCQSIFALPGPAGKPVRRGRWIEWAASTAWPRRSTPAHPNAAYGVGRPPQGLDRVWASTAWPRRVALTGQSRAQRSCPPAKGWPVLTTGRCMRPRPVGSPESPPPLVPLTGRMMKQHASLLSAGGPLGSEPGGRLTNVGGESRAPLGRLSLRAVALAGGFPPKLRNYNLIAAKTYDRTGIR